MSISLIFSITIYQMNFHELNVRLENLQRGLLSNEYIPLQELPFGGDQYRLAEARQASQQMIMSLFYVNLLILIGGGVGIAPILNLHNLLKKDQIDHILIMGARNEREHFLDHEPKKQIYMSTNDASIGIAGNVVDALQSIFPNGNHPEDCKIYSCGPPMMMEGVRSYALKHCLDCDLALETIMACGVGICQGCTVEKKTSKEFGHSYRNRFSLACMDGPIFNAKEIISCM